jgi:hypothetical protein
MPSVDDPQAPHSLWHDNMFVWYTLIAFIGLAILYYACRTYQYILFRREPQYQQQNLPATDSEHNWDDAVPLQQLQRVFTRQGNDVDLPAPRYEGHVNDEGVPEGVKLEKRGKYHYVVKGEDLPPYHICEECRPSG